MNTRMVFAAVIGVLTLVIGFFFVGPLYQANDKFYRALNSHCILSDGSTSIKLHSKATPASQITLLQTPSATTCSVPLAEGNAITDWQTEERSQAGLAAVTGGTAVVASTALPGSTWVPRPSLFNQFGPINNLLAELVPLLIVLGFVGIIGANLFTYARSETSSLVNVVGTEVLMLVMLMVAVNLATPFLSAVVNAAGYNDGTLTSTQQFSAITELVFALIPLGYSIAILGLIGWRGLSAVKGVRGSMGGGQARSLAGSM